MAFSSTTVKDYKFRLHIRSGIKANLHHLPRTIRLPKKFHFYPSQKSSKMRAIIADHHVPSTPANPEEDILRGCQKNQPRTVWDNQTLASLAPLDSELESHSKEVEAMKVKVKNMLLDYSTRELPGNIQFINLLCRLGVSYHFEDEINEQLNGIFMRLPKLLEDNEYDLCTLANSFRVLRQYGYKMTSDVFKKFKGKDGEFKEGITNDVQGILSLYEACFLAVPGEDILDEALAFTRKHLEILAENSSLHLQKHIKTTLMCPSHRTIPRLDVFQYISFYEEDEYADETLLKFAKLDYNGVQLLYQKELSILARWWENFNVADNAPYARDRLAECHVWSVGLVFEPQYSLSRILISKLGNMITLLDDTYDSYGTMDEIRLLTSALQRFTIEAGDALPEPLKFVYKAIFEVVENDHDTQRCSCKTTYVREMTIELARAYEMEKIWQEERKAPSTDEYMKNGKVTSTHDTFTASFFCGVENMGMKEILWVRNDPQIVAAAKLCLRFHNDIVKDETDRGDFPKILDCYMAEHGVSKIEATEAIEKIVENHWKEMNEYMLKPSTIPRILLMFALNFARTGNVYSYPKGDWFTCAQFLKPRVASLFINPFPIL